MLDRIKNFQHELSDWIIRKNPWIALDKRAEFLLKHFETDLKPGSSVLDIGAGPGVYYEPLGRRGHSVTLLDVKRFASCPYPLTFFDGKSIPFPDKSFDVSLLITVLHHTPDPEATLREARRVTRESVVVIEDIYETFPGKILTWVRDAALNFEIIGHPLNFKSYSGWQESVRSLGFSVKRMEKFYSYLLGLPIHTGLFILKP